MLAGLPCCGHDCRCALIGPVHMCREDEESEWGSEDEEPGVRHGEEFQARLRNP